MIPTLRLEAQLRYELFQLVDVLTRGEHMKAIQMYHLLHQKPTKEYIERVRVFVDERRCYIE